MANKLLIISLHPCLASLSAMNCLFKVGLILGFALAGSEDGKYSNPQLENKNMSKYQIATLSSNNRCDFGS